MCQWVKLQNNILCYPVVCYIYVEIRINMYCIVPLFTSLLRFSIIIVLNEHQFVHGLWYAGSKTASQSDVIPDSKVHGTNMGPIWGRQDPGGPHIGPMTLLSGILETTGVLPVILTKSLGGARHLWSVLLSHALLNDHFSIGPSQQQVGMTHLGNIFVTGNAGEENHWVTGSGWPLAL